MSSSLKNRIKRFVTISKQEVENQNHLFFSPLLPESMHWRAYPDFKERCCFLDIETTGLDKYNDDITTIGLFDGKQSRVFVNGTDLDEFKKEIEKYSMIVTFNGACFDLPFISNKFNMQFDHLHIDLRWALKRLGLTGGLKYIEKTLEITRDDEVADMDGWEAVKLWYRYKKGDRSALHLLIKYNIEDIENLKTLMDYAYSNLKKEYDHFFR